MPFRPPVPGFPLEFEWQDNEWLQVFDRQVGLLLDDITRARTEDRMVVYLSCPISSKGGSFKNTNVEIARATQRRIQERFGSRVWVLNPAQYQLESKEGAGLLRRHAVDLGISLDHLDSLPPPRGGDYMRMWTKVLVEDDREQAGWHFDAYYFLSPSDTSAFFDAEGPTDATEAVETYFARKYTTDLDFKTSFDGEADWESLRKDFVRFYTFRSGAAYSSGCHDEWNILCLLNERRLKTGGVGDLLSAWWDGRQVTPGAMQAISPGYGRTASRKPTPKPMQSDS